MNVGPVADSVFLQVFNATKISNVKTSESRSCEVRGRPADFSPLQSRLTSA